MPSNSKESADGNFREANEEPFPILWVGNLAVDTLDFDLMTLFSKHGILDCVMSFSARNFAFLYFKHAADAKAAKDDLQGALVRGNSIRIEFARPAKPCKQLWVGGLSPSVTKEQLEEEFSKFGKIEDQNFNRERNTSMIEFYRVDDAAAALKNMDGKELGGEKIRVDYLRSGSQYSRRDSSDHSSRHFSGASRHSSSGSISGQVSRILSINHPPSVRVDEQMLYNAMILFGEIDQVKVFPERCSAFVEFRSMEEARRAKEGLMGRLFNDPRIQIQYSSDESFSFGQGHRQDSFNSDHPFGRTKYSHRGYPNMPSMGRQQPFPQRGHFDGGSSDFHGPNFSRLSPTPGNVWEGSYDGRDAKRSRIEGSPFDEGSLPMKRMEGPMIRNQSFGVNGPGPGPGSPFGGRRPTPGFPSRDHCWRGVIAKGGTLVCHARCVPVGKGVESPLPEVVNCSARTGLDMLSKHYQDADGFDIVFFLPDSEEDFASYTEFLQYLRLKNRAGVAKLEDGTTLFLVPPSDFLTHVLKVNGPERLYGVVLKIPQQIPAIERQQTPDLLPRVDYRSSQPTATASAPVPRPVEVSLTPELIATLAAVIPAPGGMAQMAAPPVRPYLAQSQQPGILSAMPAAAGSYMVAQSQQPGVLPAPTASNYLMQQQSGLHTHPDVDFLPNGGYGMSSQISQQGPIGQPVGQEFTGQLQPMQNNPQSSNLAPLEGETEKNQKYQSTLQLAANLLLQIQQQQKQANSQSMQGSGGHQ